jgi:hypothetical protein
MTLFEMFSLIKLICNKDYLGNVITPERFQQLIKLVNIDLFRNKYGLPEEYQPGKPIPREYVEITLKVTDDLKAFKVFTPNVSLINGVLPYPQNYAHKDEVIYNFVKTINKKSVSLPRGVEVLRESQLATRLGNYTKRPTLLMPVGVMRSDGIHIYPTVVSDLNPVVITSVDFAYFRWPVDPVFGYNQMDGYITENSATSVQFEWPVDEHITLLAMILKWLGINLREADIVQIANQQLNTGQ